MSIPTQKPLGSTYSNFNANFVPVCLPVVGSRRVGRASDSGNSAKLRYESMAGIKWPALYLKLSDREPTFSLCLPYTNGSAHTDTYGF